MLKNAFTIFNRDLKTVYRESMGIIILVMPIIMAILIRMFTPGLNDTTVNLALLKSDTQKHIDYLDNFAKIELFDTEEQIINRINRRDDIVGILPTEGGYKIVLQGNESEVVESYSKTLNALYELDSTVENTTATLYSFGHTVPPLKTMLVNMLISMTIMLSGMLIAMSIVGEKADNTINAVNVSPASQNSFILGKSMMGGFIALISISISLFITGYYDINWLMIILVGLSSLILSLVVGFVQGINSDDIIEASANVKMIMLPVAGSIAGYELLAANWQWLMYWSPFYWAYKANLLVLSKTADWGTILFCTFMVFALSMVIYFTSMPKIRKGLS